ncbi:Short-chain dehydrogenase/reductase SDR like protein, partial [Aduncisulcus paluster]
AEAEELIVAAPHIETEADLLEGLQYLAQGIAACTHMAFHTDRDHPFLLSGTGPFTKMGLDNPDTLYFGARVNGEYEYVVTGKRGTTADLSFQVLGGGDYTDKNVPGSAIAFDDREIHIARDGSFELVMREVYSDWREQRGSLAIARVDTAGTAPAPLTKEQIEKRYASAGKQLVNRVKTWLQFPKWFYDNLPVNTMTEPRLTPGGLATQFSSVGHYDLTDDQAMIITVPKSDAPYQGFQLGSLWYISLDYINHQTSLNSSQAQVDPDGNIRMVVSNGNPGVTNWIETLDHRRAYLQFRWQRADRPLTAADGPTVEVVAFGDVPAKLPLCAFDGKVIVVSGIGPGLGATLATKFAAAGADVVLAARTQSRLDEVAEQIAATGRKALAVATDITDEASVANLVERATETFGGIDVLVNNAFSIPSMKSLEKTDYQHIRDSVELTVVGTLRLTQGLAGALSAAKGSVVNINSMVIRHSQVRYGSYKIAKAALL